ncbi:MAG: M24 family metallopeptidase [Candidatus Thorarchaeota archaeon]
MLADIDGLMAKYAIDALFLEGKSLLKNDLFYMTGFLSVDDLFFVKLRDQPGILAASDMVCKRAKKYSRITEFHSISEVINQAIRDGVSRAEMELRILKEIAKNLLPNKGIIGVPRNTDAQSIHDLQKIGVKIQPVQDLFLEARETKDRNEIQAINRASRAVESTFLKVVEIFQNCEIGPNKILLFEKKPLTVGRIKQAIDSTLSDNYSESSEESIVAGGKKGSDFHYLGFRKDKLRANEPIIIDIFPRRLEERYHADVTRTIVRGTVSKKLSKLVESVKATLFAVIDALKAGGTTQDLVNEMVNSFERDGHHTVNRVPGITEGMLHSLGHGIGLDIHENPRLSLQPTLINPGSVLAIEPALYYPQIGGIRIEDNLLVTKKGVRILTRLPRILYL